MDAVSAVILDYGEVICRAPERMSVERMAAALGHDPITFESHHYYPPRGPYDRGDIDAAAYWSAVAGDVNVPGPHLLAQLRRLDIEIWSDVDPRMIEWLGRLRAAGFKTAVLSNMHADMAAHFRRTFGWLRDLDAVVLSCEVRRIKPEREIFERCAALLGVRPDEALFVDDRERNVLGASEAGMRGIRFESVEQLKHELTQLRFAVLPR